MDVTDVGIGERDSVAERTGEVIVAMGSKEETTGLAVERRAAVDSGELAKRQDAIALKYLDVARAEVLDRMKTSNQTLIVYVGGLGAIVGWMYQATIAHTPTPGQLATDVPGRGLEAVVFPVGAVVAFLGFAASWIIFHNERMVNALARYQKGVLEEYFKTVAPKLTAWESSDALHQTDNGFATIAMTILVQAILIIGPSVVFLGGMFHYTGYWFWRVTPTNPFEVPCFVAALALTAFAIVLSCLTIAQRRALRDEPR